MYDKEFSFTGKHAIMIEDLTKYPYKTSSGASSSRFVFKTNIDVFLVAPLIGVLFDRKADKDPSTQNTKIFGDQFKSRYNDIEFLIKLVILTFKDEHMTSNDKIELAFKGYYDSVKSDYIRKTFEFYLLGGIEYLHEMIIQDTKSIDEVVRKFEIFNDIFQDNYGT
jgi:hypothetical protein